MTADEYEWAWYCSNYTDGERYESRRAAFEAHEAHARCDPGNAVRLTSYIKPKQKWRYVSEWQERDEPRRYKNPTEDNGRTFVFLRIEREAAQ